MPDKTPTDENTIMPVFVYLLSLGCAKNIVDSEVMSGSLGRSGFSLTDNPAEADVIIINTCGFIEAAKQESIGAILEMAAYKEQGRCRLLVAVGCMVQKYAADLSEAMPEIDLMAGSSDYELISVLIADKLGLKKVALPAVDAYLLRELPPATATAYLKIAEGCSNRCSYCLIPQLRGPYKSRPQEDILAEARQLFTRGIREIILIAQDTTRYGYDLYGEYRLPQLLDQIAALPFDMVRLLYVYPDLVSEELLQTMSAHANVCRYLDVPVQHGTDKILRAMHRRGGRHEIEMALQRIRAYLPDVALRTTVMVGFPGETDEDFAELLDFLAQAEFDWLGAFPYYQEDDTPAAELDGQVDEITKQERLDAVMRQAAVVTERRLRRFVGRTLRVLAEEPDEESDTGVWRGRSEFQSPDVDGVVLFSATQPIQAGQLYKVRITGSDIYDLMGEAE